MHHRPLIGHGFEAFIAAYAAHAGISDAAKGEAGIGTRLNAIIIDHGGA